MSNRYGEAFQIRIQIVFLITLQIISTAVLLVLNPISQVSTDIYALYLSVDLLSFGIVSYVYRVGKDGRLPNTGWVAIGYLAVMVLLMYNLFLE